MPNMAQDTTPTTTTRQSARQTPRMASLENLDDGHVLVTFDLAPARVAVLHVPPDAYHPGTITALAERLEARYGNP